MFIVLPKIFIGTRELRKEGRDRLREGKEGKREEEFGGGSGVGGRKGERSRKGARKRKENTQL